MMLLRLRLFLGQGCYIQWIQGHLATVVRGQFGLSLSPRSIFYRLVFQPVVLEGSFGTVEE